MRAVGVLIGLFGAGGLATGVIHMIHSMHVEPIGMALLAFMTAGGAVLFQLGSARVRARSERVPELSVLKVAEKHHGRVTPVLVAAETALPVDAAEAELKALAESGVCVRRSDDAGAIWYLFPELENEAVKQKLFFADAQAKRGQKVGS